MCVCEWKDHRVVSMCGAHYEAAQRHADYEVKLATKELLEALKATRPIIRGRHSTLTYGPKSLLDQIDAAIAKAEGRS